MKVLIIGLGSIAKKHIVALRKLVSPLELYALRSIKPSNEMEGVHNLYSLSDAPANIDFIMICNPTVNHYETIKECIPFKCPLFIEKPVLKSLEGSNVLLASLEKNNIKSYVAFSLRFHPVIKFLKIAIKGKTPIEASVYCGSYLPDWRPNTDYTKSYSASESRGGGVHLDVIHELDYVYWLFGKPDNVNSVKLKISDLQITSKDYANYTFIYERFVANISLNYFRKKPKRIIEIVFKDEIWTANLLKCEVTNEQGEVLFSNPDYNVLDTYENQLQYFINHIESKNDYENNVAESLNVLTYCLK
ncbi:Gfo/Idh/MocA family oxidoreductase [Carboxylicivirga sediminis]|uniref:Gfo/Idh/MocA family oxidoreductase n=1 Tax=Carboxylicivirga sediminis TaxID=2006564 RepID=A0A941F6J4_9BACT|nr:Gfo/Idh/MocA family oxidoreductase [Carboxylicivirga sediminis]MBR8537384.1 Gfo/Idh/MocA family oxidoreductase [Carboxylicivirga sediminis]